MVNEKSRQFLSVHCQEYTRWDEFRKEFTFVLSKFDSWIDNGIVAFNLHYIDELKVENSELFISKVFNAESNFLPKRFFKSKSNFLVFNSTNDEKSDDYNHNDRIEIRTDNNEIVISQNSIIPVGHHSTFTNFVNCPNCSSKIEWAHNRNKELLVDLLNKEILDLIGLKINNG